MSKCGLAVLSVSYYEQLLSISSDSSGRMGSQKHLLPAGFGVICDCASLVRLWWPLSAVLSQPRCSLEAGCVLLGLCVSRVSSALVSS